MSRISLDNSTFDFLEYCKQLAKDAGLEPGVIISVNDKPAFPSNFLVKVKSASADPIINPNNRRKAPIYTVVAIPLDRPTRSAAPTVRLYISESQFKVISDSKQVKMLELLYLNKR